MLDVEPGTLTREELLLLVPVEKRVELLVWLRDHPEMIKDQLPDWLQPYFELFPKLKPYFTHVTKEQFAQLTCDDCIQLARPEDRISMMNWFRSKETKFVFQTNYTYFDARNHSGPIQVPKPARPDHYIVIDYRFAGLSDKDADRIVKFVKQFHEYRVILWLRGNEFTDPRPFVELGWIDMTSCPLVMELPRLLDDNCLNFTRLIFVPQVWADQPQKVVKTSDENYNLIQITHKAYSLLMGQLHINPYE